MKESVFQREIMKTLKLCGQWCIKIPDAIKTRDTRFIPKKSCDLVASIYGRSVLIECKQMKKICKINKKFFASTKEKKEKDLFFKDYWQVSELLRHKIHAKNPSFYFLNIRIPREKNILLIFEVEELCSIFEKKDYISKEELEQYIEERGLEGRKGLFLSENFRKFLEKIQKESCQKESPSIYSI